MSPDTRTWAFQHSWGPEHRLPHVTRVPFSALGVVATRAGCGRDVQVGVLVQCNYGAGTVPGGGRPSGAGRSLTSCRCGRPEGRNRAVRRWTPPTAPVAKVRSSSWSQPTPRPSPISLERMARRVSLGGTRGATEACRRTARVTSSSRSRRRTGRRCRSHPPWLDAPVLANGRLSPLFTLPHERLRKVLRKLRPTGLRGCAASPPEFYLG